MDERALAFVIDETTLEGMRNDLKKFVDGLPKSIGNDQEFEACNKAVISVTKERKKVKAGYDRLKEPFELEVKRLKGLCAKDVAFIQGKENELRQLSTSYYKKQEEAKRKEQEKENKKFDNRVNNAIQKGKDIAEVVPPKAITPIDKTAKTEQGSVTFKKVRKVIITDASQIPDRFYKRVLNEAMVKACALAGDIIPGVVVTEEVESAVRGA